VAASAAAAPSLRLAPHDAAIRVLLTLGAGAAVAVTAACLTFSAFLLLKRAVDPAGAWAIPGAFWGLVGLVVTPVPAGLVVYAQPAPATTTVYTNREADYVTAEARQYKRELN
jgi:hypothetical protein